MSNKKSWLKQGLNQSVILKKSLAKEPEQEGSARNAKLWLLGTEETYGVGIIMEIFGGNGWHFFGGNGWHFFGQMKIIPGNWVLRLDSLLAHLNDDTQGRLPDLHP